jgi:hypothetical protein
VGVLFWDGFLPYAKAAGLRKSWGLKASKRLDSECLRDHLRNSLLHEKHNGHHEWMSLQNEFRPVGTRIYPVRRARISSNQAFQTASNKKQESGCGD